MNKKHLTPILDNYAHPSRFDWVVSGAASGPDELCDKEIDATEGFSVIPSKGSLVSGWTLIVPKKQSISLKTLGAPLRRELVDFAEIVEAKLCKLYAGKVIVKFEHGPCSYNSLTGCGVDQAHLHLVPLNAGIENEIYAKSGDLNWFEVDNVDPWKTLNSTSDYYLIWIDNKCYVSYPKQITSQFFRRIIADFVSKPDEWDYKTNPQYHNVNDTIERFGTIDR